MSENSFIGYEYRKLTVNSDMESVYIDGYTNLGWEFVSGNSDVQQVPAGKVVLEFKRNREIPNKAELARLQRRFDACAEEIAASEKKKSVPGIIAGIEIGAISCCLIAGSITAFTTSGSHVLLGVILAIPGWLGSVAAYFCAVAVNRKMAEKLEPSIEKKYDEIFEINKKGSELLNDNRQTAEKNDYNSVSITKESV